jgi:hypothetical protein
MVGEPDAVEPTAFGGMTEPLEGVPCQKVGIVWMRNQGVSDGEFHGETLALSASTRIRVETMAVSGSAGLVFSAAMTEW